MLSPVTLSYTISLQDKLLPQEVREQIARLCYQDGSYIVWELGEIASDVSGWGESYAGRDIQGERIDYNLVDNYLKSLGAKEGDTIIFLIWW
jgi:hypothetical protein